MVVVVAAAGRVVAHAVQITDLIWVVHYGKTARWEPLGIGVCGVYGQSAFKGKYPTGKEGISMFDNLASALRPAMGVRIWGFAAREQGMT